MRIVLRAAAIGLTLWLVLEFVMPELMKLFKLETGTRTGKLLQYLIIGLVVALVLPVVSRLTSQVAR